MPEALAIYTVGHSNQTMEDFLELLGRNQIQSLVDVRSTPYSQWVSHFNREPLKESLWKAEIGYEYEGGTLGGHPSDSSLYDREHRVVYERMVNGTFRRIIAKLVELAGTRRTVIMCTEEDPEKCHRHPLLARYLLERKVDVLHIRRNGEIVRAATLFGREVTQAPLFEISGEDGTWRSPKQIRARR
jgi:uncharacterized protein (DUF488 family)